MRLTYRVKQFYRSLTARSDLTQRGHVLEILDPPLAELFYRMTPSDQAHSLRVLKVLELDGQTDPDLLAAALLHDVGKSVHPPSILDRIIVVLANQFFSGRVLRWGNSEPHGWRRPFAIAVHHAGWGAELAAAHGASPSLVDLIRSHQDPLPAETHSLRDTLAKKLHRADNEN